jgi:hypothetical protein
MSAGDLQAHTDVRVSPNLGSPAVEDTVALTEYHRVHASLNMEAARWPN